jgi:predicted DNA-binding transcriptional regulator YafY
VWTGCVKQKDLVRVFSISSSLASTDLNDAIKDYPQFLSRDGRMGVKFTGMDTPFDARASKLLSMFERGADEWETGLGKDEIQILANNISVHRPDEKIINTILFACIREVPIKIKYTSLNMDEIAKSRVVYPIGLEFNGRQCRVIATDEKTSIQKTFVLARISEASFLSVSVKRISKEKLKNELNAYRVTFNESFTQDQIRVLKNEFDIANETLSMSSRDLYEFKKLYCKTTANDLKSNVVWPIFSTIELDTRN